MTLGSISNTLSEGIIIFQLTFLFDSYYVYKSDHNINPIEAFIWPVCRFDMFQNLD